MSYVNANSVTENVISDVLHKVIDLDPEYLRQIKTALYMVLNGYDIAPKCTELQVIDDSWMDDLMRYCERKAIAGRSKGTLARYYYVMTHVLSYINKSIKEITPGDLNEYIERYKFTNRVSNNTLHGVRLCISAFFTWQHEHGYIPTNPAKGVDPIKVPKTVKKAYSDEDMEKIKSAAKDIRDRAIVEFLYSTGVRISEMTALNIDDIDFMTKTIVVNGKGSKERQVYLSDVAAMYLKAYMDSRNDDCPALFIGNRKPYKRLDNSGVRAMLKKCGAAVGVDKVHPHRFRTTMATNLVAKGMPIEEVSILLGHEKLDTTKIYTLVDDARVKNNHKKYIG